VRVLGDAALLADVDLHLAPFRSERPASEFSVLIDRYENAPSTSRVTVVDDYEFGAGAYHRRESRFRFDILSRSQTYYMDRLNLPINLVIQLALLKAGYTFIHGAGLSIGGRRVLFPAYPGTGKTTLVAGFVRSGAQLFGDDLCIVGNGRIFSYPQCLSVYPHHLDVLGYHDPAIKRAFRRNALIDRVRRQFLHGRSPFARLARLLLAALGTPSVNVSPTVVFGAEAIAADDMLDEVIILERAGEISQLVVERVDVASAAMQAATILWHEWHGSFHDLLLYDALSEAGHGTIARFHQVRDVAQRAFESVPCMRVRIPAAWDNATLVREFPPFWRAISR
jgi:hypothetical protein